MCKYDYPLVNVYIAMERSTILLMGKSTISMAIFHSYVSLPEGKPPFSYGFPMGFPMDPMVLASKNVHL